MKENQEFGRRVTLNKFGTLKGKHLNNCTKVGSGLSNQSLSLTFDKKIATLKNEILAKGSLVLDNMECFFGNKPKYIIFISVCDTRTRAKVFQGVGNSIEASWKNALIECRKYLRRTEMDVKWVKADLVKDIEEYTLEEFNKYSSNIRQHYLRKGISLDKFFNLAFLEQEVNANGFIKRTKDSITDELHIKNINLYSNTDRSITKPIKLSALSNIYLFTTYGYFCDDNCYELHSEGLENGRRTFESIDNALVYDIIEQASNFLAKQVQFDGKFVYGYFPAFDRKIEWYNILRHASTVYSMIEAYELTSNNLLKLRINKAINYLISEGIKVISTKEEPTVAYVVDTVNHNEIKLGANAAAILALSKYTEVFKDHKYMQLMTLLANGIETLQDKETGGFIHVLNFPDMTVKERFRIIYYDGEAAFALMRLYGLDKNHKWLEAVEKAFAYFIKENYWKHHDHWLSYCVNELTKHNPLREYFEFGLKNAEGELDFILDRETTYPTFLELLMATYSMVKRIKKDKTIISLLDHFDFDKLIKAIKHRAKLQLNGFMFPEVAMYFKSPSTVLGSFFIRHHSFRVRIDDIEHNISGYYHYYNEILLKD